MPLPTKIDDRSDLLTKQELFVLVAIHGILLDQKSTYSVTEAAQKAVEVATELMKVLNESKGHFFVE